MDILAFSPLFGQYDMGNADPIPPAHRPRADASAMRPDLSPQSPTRDPGHHSPLLILGCTGAGKTAVALHLAHRVSGEILSVDSMQVYRRMDVGTAKPSAAERAAVPHHMIDVVEPSEAFSVARFVEMADRVIADVHARGRPLIVVAGTPLYLMGLAYGLFDGPSADPVFRAEFRRRAEIQGLASLHAELARVDPESAARIHVNDSKRIERALEVWHLTGRPLSAQQVQWSADRMRHPFVVVGIRRAKDDLNRRINARVREMIHGGLVAEVRALLAEQAGMSEQARQALGYAEIIEHLAGKWTLDEAIERIKMHTRRFAKHQRTWFRKFPAATWVDAEPDAPPGDLAARVAAAAARAEAAGEGPTG